MLRCVSLRQKAGALQFLEVGQLVQTVEPPEDEEFRRCDIGVGRTGLWAARSGRDQAGTPHAGEDSRPTSRPRMVRSSARVTGWK